MNKIATSVIPERHQIIAIMCFPTRSYNHWCYTDDARIKNFNQNAPDSLFAWKHGSLWMRLSFCDNHKIFNYIYNPQNHIVQEYLNTQYQIFCSYLKGHYVWRSEREIHLYSQNEQHLANSFRFGLILPFKWFQYKYWNSHHKGSFMNAMSLLYALQGVPLQQEQP